MFALYMSQVENLLCHHITFCIACNNKITVEISYLVHSVLPYDNYIFKKCFSFNVFYNYYN